MGKYIGHRLVVRSELDNTFWTYSTIYGDCMSCSNLRVRSSTFSRFFFQAIHFYVQFRKAISGHKSVN